MNEFALRIFVRSLINEAKEKKAEKEPKKSIKKEDKAPKSDGKLIDLKKELAALKQYRDELQAAKFAEKTASTEIEFADLAHFAKELEAIKKRGADLEKEIEEKIKELETKISDEKNKIKEMMGLVPEKKGKDKMVDEDKKPVRVTPDNEIKADKDIPGLGMSEARFKKGEDIGKKGKGFEKIEKSVEKKYIKSHTPSGKKPSETTKKHAEEAGKKVAGAILKKVVKK